MAHLIGKQQSIADTIIKGLNDYQIENSMYLSGEMGVGKTYISSYVINQLFDQHQLENAIIVCPTIVKTKWKKVLTSFLPNDYQVECLTRNQLSLSKMHKTKTVYIITPTILKTLTEFINDHRPYYLELKRALIIDEIQEIKQSQIIKYLPDLVQAHTYKLYMTGTIFDSLNDGLTELVSTTHPRLIDRLYHDQPQQIKLEHFKKILFNNLPLFMLNLWQYISVSISLNDINADQHVNQQNILPIKYLELTPEQKAYYDLIAFQAKGFKYAGQIASNILDNPQSAITIEHKSPEISGQNDQNQTLLTLPLKEIQFKDTIKYQALLDHLDTLPDDHKVLIYANDVSLITQLVNNLNHDGYQTFTIDKTNSQIETKLHRMYQTHRICVINPNLIKVGIDLSEVSDLVWYQVLNHMTDILQAQRRISRMDSDTTSDIKFLAYDHTYQRQLLDDISNANKYNAAAYGVEDQSELTKLTGLLLNGINANGKE